VSHGAVFECATESKQKHVLSTTAREHIDWIQQQDSHWIAYGNKFATSEKLNLCFIMHMQA